MKKLHASLIASAVALALTQTAQAELSANIGVTSNYLWRGVTQTDDGAAVQGGIDWAHDSGFYLGTWASNINWAVYGNDANGVEVDFYGGYGGELANGLGYDIGLIYYYYPDDSYDDSDFSELYGSLSFGPIEGGLAYTIDTDAGGDDNHLYWHLGGGWDLAETWSVGATVGYYDFDGGSDSDYAHGQIDLTKSAGDFGDFTFTVSTAEEESGDDDTKFVVSWGKSF